MMQVYIGTRRIKAKPMLREAYNAYRGWDIPVPADPNDEGYLIEFMDGTTPNHPNHQGYIAWLPAEVFNKFYQTVEMATFGEVIEAIRAGGAATRKEWGSPHAFIFKEDDRTVTTSAESIFSPGATVTVKSALYYRTPGGTVKPWAPETYDMLATDWEILPKRFVTSAINLGSSFAC